MRSSGAVRHKLKQVIFRHLKKRLSAELREIPTNCAFNAEVELPSGGSLCVCIHPDVATRVCDLRWGGKEQAAGCPQFEHRRSKGELKDEFRAFLREAPLPEIASAYPDVAALLWVLGDEAPERDSVDVTVLPVLSVDGVEVTFLQDSDVEVVQQTLTRLERDKASVEALLEAREQELHQLRERVARMEQERDHLFTQLDRARSDAAWLRFLTRVEAKLPWWKRLFGGL